MLQIKGGTEANSKIIFLISQLKRMFDPSLEPSQRNGSNDGSQYIFNDRPLSQVITTAGLL